MPYPKYSLRSRLLVVSVATFLLCAGIILIFFPLLNRTLEGLMDRSIQKMREAKEVEATTIARLMVLEFSQLKDLLQAQPGFEGEVDRRIKNLIWQKVTFNEIIQGIELIQAKSDSQGRHLTYLFYRREDPELKPMGGPQKVLKDFIDEQTRQPRPEKALIDAINTRQTVDKGSLRAVNDGPKEEGQMLLRYLPVHVLVPEEGAVYWGVAKIGIDVSGLTQLLALQSKEKDRLRGDIWLAIIISLTVSGILAVSLLYFWAQTLTEPLRALSAVAKDFKTASPQEYDVWLDNLKEVDPRGQTELADLKEALERLGAAIPRLGERLFASEYLACLSRVAARALPAFQADSTKLADWQRFAKAMSEEWQTFDLTPILSSAWRLITSWLPSGARLTCNLEPLPAVLGSRELLAQAVLHLLDYAAVRLPADGILSLTATPLPVGGLKVVVASSGPACSLEEAQEVLNPLDFNRGFKDCLGPALAAAIARQHGGELSARPGDPQGLTFTLKLPPAPTEHGNRDLSP